MKLLAIDTSTELASVAISVEDEVFRDEQQGLRQHAQLLLPMIQNLLIRSELTLKELDGIVFGRGPGSFTGLRIACSIAKGLAFAHNLPVYPVSSLAAIANEAYVLEPEFKGSVLSMLDARMDQVYWGCYPPDNITVIEQVSCASKVELNSKDALILAGVGFEKYVAQLSEMVQLQVIQQISLYPKAEAMLRIVKSGQVNKTNAKEALPVYLRNQVTQGEKTNG